jgi:hypothetical protein
VPSMLQSKYKSDPKTDGELAMRFLILAFVFGPKDLENLLGVPTTFTPLPAEMRFSYMTAQKK